MAAFLIVRNYRQKTQNVQRPKKIRKAYRSSTKNNLHHFGAILKRLNTELSKQGVIS